MLKRLGCGLMFALSGACAYSTDLPAELSDEAEAAVELNPNRTVIEGPTDAADLEEVGKLALPLVEEGTDQSGRVTVQVVECYSSARRQRQTVDCTVDPSFVLISGGARAETTGCGGGLLTEVRPKDSSLQAFRASSKDHIVACSHYLYVYAVGLKLSGASRATLAANMELKTSTSSSAQQPVATVVTSSGFQLIGGGAKVNWTEPGVLLFRSSSQSDGRTWVAQGKDHGAVSSATITAYAVGIRPTIPGFGTLEFRDKSVTTNAYSGTASAAVSVDSGWITASAGGFANWGSGNGRLLTGIVPSLFRVEARDKDHSYVDEGTLVASMREIRQQP